MMVHCPLAKMGIFQSKGGIACRDTEWEEPMRM